MFIRKTQEWCPEDLDLTSGDDKEMYTKKTILLNNSAIVLSTYSTLSHSKHLFEDIRHTWRTAMWGRSLRKMTEIPEISVKPEIQFRNFNKQRYNMGQIIARDRASLVVSKLWKKSRVALRRSRKKQSVIQCPTCAGLLAHVVEVLGIQYIILVSIVRTVTLMNGRSMETILRARSRSLPKRGNRQFTFGNPGEHTLPRSHSRAPSAPSAASNRVKEAPVSYFTINVVSCVMGTVLNYHACVLHKGTFQRISQDSPPAGAASQTAKLDATHNTGSAISLWYYFEHVMELTRSTGTKRCILSRQIPPWYQQQRENKYLIGRTNGPKPKLIDPPIQENGINIIHMQMLKNKAIVIINLFKKFSLPMKQCMM
ncbi:hypothetical protein ALC60_04872 [Trachymyrmex zeteki]|uniref:Uncharacterized protein n=1 Tax=Mycetomoellerius zeteki TaxID=64791 RepID=A0A151X7I1_9HYME|nr:hypothetical protein ALC60_04872 [Trachymyrmex zeteki]